MLGFLIGFVDRPPLVAICVHFFHFFVRVFHATCMVCGSGFADTPLLVAICVFLLFCFVCFDAMCMSFLIGLADRPPLVAIRVDLCFFRVFNAMCMVSDRFSRHANR